MTTESLAPTVDDVVDACVLLAPGHPVHAVRHARAKVVAATQASHDGLVTTVAALSLPLTTPGTGVALFAGDALARWAAQFDARGPPLTS